MKNKILLQTLWLLALSPMAIAQNNPIFFGGSGDGYGRSNYEQITNDPLIHHGGIGDGIAIAGYHQNIVSHFTGGVGDGYNVSASGIPNLDKIFFGGNADGTASAASGTPLADQIFYGGPGDGWSSNFLPSTPLPLSLLSFTGTQRDGMHILNWEIALATTPDYFVLERSANTYGFNDLGKVRASANAADQHQYEYIDKRPLKGNNFYRLKMVTPDGKATYSSIVLLRLLKDNAVLNIYPNPTASVLHIELSGKDNNSEVMVDIYDASAKLVQHKTMKKNHDAFQVNVQTLAPGIYSIRITDREEINVVKFIKN